MGRKSKELPISEISVSFWKDMKKVQQVDEITLGEVIETIQSDKLRPIINKIRKLRAQDEKNDVRNHKGVLQYELSKPEKEKLPSIISAGTFKSRSKKGLIQYKGIMAIDYDHIPKKEIESLRTELNENPYVYTVFTSPSGEGLKVLIRTDATTETHRDTYLQWGKEFPNEYWDKNVHDYSRLMFLSWDPLITTNGDCATYKYVRQAAPKEDIKKKTKKNSSGFNRSKSFESRDLEAVLETVLPKLPMHYADERMTWISGINALIGEFGEGARELVHLFSSRSDKYSRENTDQAFDNEIRTFTPGGSTVGTIAHWCKESSIPFFSDTEALFKKGMTIKEVAEEAGISEEDAREIKESIKEKVKTPVVAIEHIKENYAFGKNVITGQVVDRGRNNKVMNPDDVYTDLIGDGYEMSPGQVKAICNSEQIAPEFDPFKEYFKKISKRDVEGHDNIDKLSGMVQLTDEGQREFFTRMFRKHMIRAVGAAMDASVNRVMLVLTDDGKENIGKSSLFRWIGGQNIRKENIHDLAEYYSEQPITVSKDTELSLTETFVYNIEELEEMSPKELAHFKQVISKGKSRVRRPYAAHHEILSRRCTFFASTNNDMFLAEGKNTRYLIFCVDAIDWSYETEIDVNDVWAEAYKMWSENQCAGDLNRSDYVIQGEMNKDHKIGDPMEDYILEKTNLHGDWTDVSAHVFQQALKKRGLYKSNQQMSKVYKALPELIIKKRDAKTRRTVYAMRTLSKHVHQIYIDADMANESPINFDDGNYLNNNSLNIN
jgi:hypothetical protein